MLLSILMLTLYVAAIWGIIRLLVPERLFYASEFNGYSPEDYIQEERILLEDLTNRTTESGMNIIPVRFDRGLPEPERRALADMGVAENHRIAEDDNENKHPGDYWLCDGRWEWFCALAWAISLVFVSLLGFFEILLGPAYAMGMPAFVLLLVIIWLAAISIVTVEENVRLGIFRFGDQQDGFLGDGLQFILPFGIETMQDVPLQNLAWGPQSEGTDQDGLHLKGTINDPDTNPRPGVFLVSVGGRWKVKVTVVVTVRVRRKYKRPWYDYLNEYVNADEIGESTAGIIGAVLSTFSREVSEQARKSVREASGDEVEEAAEIMLIFLNQIPEISAKIMLTLHQVGRTRLAGILPVSVAFSSVSPDEEFRQVLQQVDEARVHRLVERMRGEATRERVARYVSVLESVDGDVRRAMTILDFHDTVRQWDRNGEGDDLSRLARTFTTRLLKNQQPSA